MTEGVRLSLMAGPVYPVPVPSEVVEALTSVQVTRRVGKASGFQLRFTLSTDSPLHTLFLLTGGGTIPILRVVLVATVKGTPHVLIDGVVSNHEVTPGSEPGRSVLTLTGEDLSRVMDFIPLDGIPYPAMPPEVRVLATLARYAPLGIVPAVIPSPMVDVPIPVQEIPRHKGTDLHYIRLLAEKVGYIFHITPGPEPGMNIAYWGPEVKVGAPQPALNVDMDAHTNVESLTFNFDGDARELPVIFIQNQATKVIAPIPIPDITPLNPPLGIFQSLPKKVRYIRETAKHPPVRAALLGLAHASRSADTITGSGKLDTVRYGHVLKEGELVGVRGAGPAFNGLHYVKSVTHEIERGSYKQSFELSRNGLVSTLPKVPP